MVPRSKQRANVGLFNFDEGIQADALILATREMLAEAERVSRGELVRVRVQWLGESDSPTMLYPFRVIDYAVRALGAAVPVAQQARVMLFTCGVELDIAPSTPGLLAFLRALCAHDRAERRRLLRERARLVAKLKKGGAAL